MLMKKKCVLVTGGAGFIGSVVNKMLHKRGFETVVLDNLSASAPPAIAYGAFIKGDIGDAALLDALFEKYAIDAVMHFAAFIDVGESVKDPAKYYDNNVSGTLQLLKSMLKHSVKTLIFSSSAAIFGNPTAPRIDETHPCHPINPYGETKWMVERILRDFSAAYGLKYCSLRYFNAAGGDPEGEIKYYPPSPSNLIPRILLTLKKQESNSIEIFGVDYPTHDGTCIRDYIHVEDLGQAHISALEQLLQGAPSNAYNLGCGTGYSVKEVIKAAEETLKRKVNVIVGERRPGDPAVLLADSSRALRELQWQPRYSVHDMIAHAWECFGISE